VPEGGDLAVAGGGGADELEQVCGPVVEPPGVAGDQLELLFGGGCVELFLKPGLPVR
jgi:hypothetical protein